MRNLKLLNKKYLLVLLIYLFFGSSTQSQEPVDIWKIEKKESSNEISTIDDIGEKKIL